MKYSTVYVGMDVHKETFSLACYTNEKEEAEYVQRTDSLFSDMAIAAKQMKITFENN